MAEAVRGTMSYLIDDTEDLLNDSSNDLFSALQYQRGLDRRRKRVKRVRLAKDSVDQFYEAPGDSFEGVVGDTSGSWTGAKTIALYDGRSSGAAVVTPTSWNLRDGTFEFTTDQNQWLFLDAWEYDIYYTAHDMCLRKALDPAITPGAGETGGAIVGRFDYRAMAHEFLRLAKIGTIELKRSRRNEFRDR
jgi:hypothetical protein